MWKIAYHIYFILVKRLTFIISARNLSLINFICLAFVFWLFSTACLKEIPNILCFHNGRTISLCFCSVFSSSIEMFVPRLDRKTLLEIDSRLELYIEQTLRKLLRFRFLRKKPSTIGTYSVQSISRTGLIGKELYLFSSIFFFRNSCQTCPCRSFHTNLWFCLENIFWKINLPL